MVSITLPRKKGADIVTALETVRKPIAAVVDKTTKREKNQNQSKNVTLEIIKQSLIFFFERVIPTQLLWEVFLMSQIF